MYISWMHFDQQLLSYAHFAHQARHLKYSGQKCNKYFNDLHRNRHATDRNRTCF